MRWDRIKHTCHMANHHRTGDSALGNKTHVDRFRFQIVHRMVHWSRMGCPPSAFFLERWVRTVTQEHSHRIRTHPCASQRWLVVLKGSLMMSWLVRPLTCSLTGRRALLLSPTCLDAVRGGSMSRRAACLSFPAPASPREKHRREHLSTDCVSPKSQVRQLHFAKIRI